MAAKTILLLFLELVLGLVLFPYFGFVSILLFLILAFVTLIAARRSSRRREGFPAQRPRPIVTPQNPMRLRKFIGLLGIVALIAILYSPSALSFNLGGGPVSQLPQSFKDIQPYVTSLQSRYSNVYIANTTSQLDQALNQTGKKAYFLIGPDNGQMLSLQETLLIKRQYVNGRLSMLISEGNYTNNIFLLDLFDVQVKGDAVVDYTSPFFNQQVFNTTTNLAGQTLPFVIDVGSPILFGNHTTMRPIATSSTKSNDTTFDPILTSNKTLAPRIVASAAQNGANRAILISDSGPFSTVYNRTWTDLIPNVNETAFTWAITNWVTNSDHSMTIILDNTHYTISPTFPIPPIGVNLPVGRLFALFLAFIISITNSWYTGFLGATRQFILGIALFTAWGFYGIMTSRYSNEPRGKDDEPVPKIEKNIRAESIERRNFLTTSRDKGFYVANLCQLYDVMNFLVQREFGATISTVAPEQLTSRLGEEQARDALRLFSQLGAIERYANGKKRIFFPPVLSWKRLTKSLTGQAEEILNELGVTMTGNVQKKQVDYKLRRG